MLRNLALLALIGCQAAEPEAPPDLVLVSIDTLRADHVGAWGHTSAKTPWIDALSALGTRFSRASTVTNNTLPSHVSMLSGQFPHTVGVPRNGHKLGPTGPWLPEILQANGYETAAFVSASALASKLRLSRGFDHFDDSFDVKEMDQRQRKAGRTVDAALAWLDKPHDKPVFVWVHVFDPHYPYTAPAPFDTTPTDYAGPADGSLEYLLGVWGRMGRDKIPTSEADRQHMVERYDAEIAYTDDALGGLLNKTQAMDALVVLTADHGESLTEHDYLFDHGEYLYQPSLHIPFIVRAPGTWTAQVGVSTEPVQTIDVAPTLLAAAGVAIPAEIEGKSLVDVVKEGGEGEVRDVALAESCRPWQIEKQHKGEYQNLYKAQSATRWPHKLIVTPYQDRVELYDLEADPGELTDIAPQHPDIVDALASEIETWRGGTLSIGRPDAENMEAIKALGYVED